MDTSTQPEKPRPPIGGRPKRTRGTWVGGIVGAVGEFAAAPGQSIDAELDGETVTANTPGAQLRFHINDDVRALTFETKETTLERSRIVLAVKCERGCPNVAHALTALGADVDAIALEDRDGQIFDLGLGRKEARFCVRVGPGETRDALLSATGSVFPAKLPRIAPELLADSPARVIETALGRIEVLTPIPQPGGQSLPGPHTHLLTDQIASGQAMPAGMEQPRAYLRGAIFYPAT